MGFFWSVVFPIINLFVYMFVFSLVLKTRWDPGQSAKETALLMLAGILVWQAFSETVSRTTNTLVENQNLIQKVVFPSEVLPVSLVISALVNMLIGLAIALLAVAWFAWIRPIEPMPVDPGAIASALPRREIGFGVSLLALPVLMACQAVFTMGLGYFFATLNLFVRDVYHLMGVFVTVWMFATPIFYPPQMVVDKGYGWMLTINPMHWLITNYREILIFGQWPDWASLGQFGLVAIVVLFLGSRFFLSQKPQFPDLL
jgi:lipopolysaccharide transport system permease protein